MKITIPILHEFRHDDVIGELTVDTDRLLPGDGWHFALGYKVLERQADEDNQPFAAIELVCVSPLADERMPRKEKA